MAHLHVSCDVEIEDWGDRIQRTRLSFSVNGARTTRLLSAPEVLNESIFEIIWKDIGKTVEDYLEKTVRAKKSDKRNEPLPEKEG